jgi:hypothetical protein
MGVLEVRADALASVWLAFMATGIASWPAQGETAPAGVGDAALLSEGRCTAHRP